MLWCSQQQQARRQWWRRRLADTEGAKEPDTPPRLLRKMAGRWVELALIVGCLFSYILALALLLRTHPSHDTAHMGSYRYN